MPGNAQNAAFYTIYPRASGGLPISGTPTTHHLGLASLLSFLTIFNFPVPELLESSNVLDMEIGWTDVGSGGVYLIVSVSNLLKSSPESSSLIRSRYHQLINITISRYDIGKASLPLR